MAHKSHRHDDAVAFAVLVTAAKATYGICRAAHSSVYRVYQPFIEPRRLGFIIISLASRDVGGMASRYRRYGTISLSAAMMRAQRTSPLQPRQSARFSYHE